MIYSDLSVKFLSPGPRPRHKVNRYSNGMRLIGLRTILWIWFISNKIFHLSLNLEQEILALNVLYAICLAFLLFNKAQFIEISELSSSCHIHQTALICLHSSGIAKSKQTYFQIKNSHWSRTSWYTVVNKVKKTEYRGYVGVRKGRM